MNIEVLYRREFYSDGLLNLAIKSMKKTIHDSVVDIVSNHNLSSTAKIIIDIDPNMNGTRIEFFNIPDAIKDQILSEIHLI